MSDDNDLFNAMIQSTARPVGTAMSVIVYLVALNLLAVSPAIVIAVWRWLL